MVNNIDKMIDYDRVPVPLDCEAIGVPAVERGLCDTA